MTFPRERGVATDLADLWTDRRSQARRRSLGLSALDPDDGALEVRDGSGSPVAMVGEYGSVRGLLVPDGAGGWRTVQADAQAKADAALATARTEIAGVRSGLSALTTRVSTAESRLSSVSSSISSLGGRVTKLEQDLTALAAVVATYRTVINSLIGTFHDRIVVLEGKHSMPPGTRPGQAA